MKQVVSDSLTKWLTTLLLSIWSFALFLSYTGAEVSQWIILPIICLWTFLAAVLDTRFGPGVVAALLTVVEVIPFLLLRGAPVISCAVALVTEGEPGTPLVVYSVVLMGAAVVSVVILYSMQHFWPRVFWSVIWLGFWIWAALSTWELPKVALAAGGTMLLVTLAEALHRRQRNAQDYRSLRQTTTVFLSALCILFLILPTSPEPYPYPVLNALVEKAEEVYEDMVTELLFREEGQGEFTMDFAGYSEDGDVGNGLQPGGLSGLLAKSWLTTDGSLYLSGNTWDTFDGKDWSDTLSGDQDDLLDWNLDTAERIYALWRYQKNNDTASTTAYMRATSVYFRYEGLNTRTLFTIPGITYIATDRERFPWDARPGRTLFDYLQTRDTYYRVYYLEQNDMRLGEWAAASEGYEYDVENDLTWLPIFGDYRAEFGLTRAVFDPDEQIETVLAQRQEQIYDAYLQLPDDLSDQVRDLAEEITSYCESDYEKLLAIAEYLRSHYTYTTEPSPVPPEKMFLDYILFETDEGYCTWYATAATILARCAGIPARYVQGYCTGLEAGVLTVLDEKGSHAWCEGYLPGFGWVTVEATPGFYNAGNGWESFPDADPEIEVEPEEENLPEEPEDLAEPSQIDFRIPAIGGFILFAALGIVWLPRKLRSRRRYRTASWSGKVQIDLGCFLTAAVRRDLRRQGEESLRQYFSRLRWMLQLDADEMERMTEFYEEVIFHERIVTETEWKRSRAFLDHLHKLRRTSRHTSG